MDTYEEKETCTKCDNTQDLSCDYLCPHCEETENLADDWSNIGRQLKELNRLAEEMVGLSLIHPVIR